jgi:hypothetical protein
MSSVESVYGEKNTVCHRTSQISSTKLFKIKKTNKMMIRTAGIMIAVATAV